MVLLCIVIAIVFLATLVKSAFGFGEGLVNMALLSLFVGLDFSVPFVALSGFFSSGLIALQDRRAIDIKTVKIFLLGAFFLVPVGIFIVGYLDEQLMRKLLAILISAFAVYNLVKPKLVFISDEKGYWGVLSGALGGLLGGAYNISGPPVVIYANLRHFDPGVFRATLQGFFTPLSLYVTIGHCIAGHYNKNILYYFLWAIPMILVGILLGKWLNRRIKDPNLFRRVIYFILALLGITMLFF